jgi:hypothetical protein
MLINLWNQRQDFTGLTPNTLVYTIVQTTLPSHFWHDSRPLLCDLAWDAEAEIKHFWLDVGGDSVTTIVRMSLQEYIDRHLRECDPINLFHGIARRNWLQLWRHHRESAKC